jgi:hypothetical protein
VNAAAVASNCVRCWQAIGAFSIRRRIGGLDCDRKAPSRVALRAFEKADIITRCCAFDARQPHPLAALEHGRIPISARQNIGLGWTDDMMLPSIGREHAALSVTDNCRYGAVMAPAYFNSVLTQVVNIAHFQRDLSDH